MKKNCLECNHSAKLSRGSHTCIHPDIQNHPCPLLEATMAKALASVLLKLSYERNLFGTNKRCLFCDSIIEENEYGPHKKDCPIPTIKKYYDAE